MLVRVTAQVLALGLAGVMSAACSNGGVASEPPNSSDGASQSSTAATYGDCKPVGERGIISLETATPGTLTVAAVLPQPGLFNGDTPDSINGGFEYCIAAEIANAAGLDNIVVQNVAFEGLIAGQVPGYDLAMSGIFITEEREKTVDFTTPYTVAPGGVMVKEGADVTQENLKSKQIGVYGGSITEGFVNDVLQATQTPRSYPTVDALNAALISGQVDAIVYDLYQNLQAEKASNGKVRNIAQILAAGGQEGAVLPEGSPNKAAFDQVINTMRSSGELDNLLNTWLVPLLPLDPSTIPEWTF